MKSMWDERYGQKEYIYGQEPNVFFKEQIKALDPGKIILPCDGEGRNGVYAATLGWTVNAFDTSEAGKVKALELAATKKVNISYAIADAATMQFPENSFDMVAFIYAHFPQSIRTQIHQKAIQWLKPGGKIILEAFNPDQLKNNSGGPKELSMLYSIDAIKTDFECLAIELIHTLQVELKEGKYHTGKADVIRCVGVKK